MNCPIRAKADALNDEARFVYWHSLLIAQWWPIAAVRVLRVDLRYIQARLLQLAEGQPMDIKCYIDQYISIIDEAEMQALDQLYEPILFTTNLN